MSIQIGDKIPDLQIQMAGNEGPIGISTGEYFADKKIALFALPGAFTPTCSAKHLPGYMKHESEIKAKGIDEIACLSVNDAFVMAAWARASRVKGKITMLCDGNAEFVRAIGLETDATRFGMGIRARRFSMIVNDGKVTHLWIENAGEYHVSSAQFLLGNI